MTSPRSSLSAISADEEISSQSEEVSKFSVVRGQGKLGGERLGLQEPSLGLEGRRLGLKGRSLGLEGRSLELVDRGLKLHWSPGDRTVLPRKSAADNFFLFRILQSFILK